MTPKCLCLGFANMCLTRGRSFTHELSCSTTSEPSEEAIGGSRFCTIAKSTACWNKTFETCSNAAAQRDTSCEGKFQADAMVVFTTQRWPASMRNLSDGSRGQERIDALSWCTTEHHGLRTHGPGSGAQIHRGRGQKDRLGSSISDEKLKCSRNGHARHHYTVAGSALFSTKTISRL